MINNNLKNAREELELTQEQLGQILGVSRKTISGWETANDPMPFDKLVLFCNIYHYSLDFITNLSNKNKKTMIPINLNKKSIGKKLKELRKSLKLSQSEFAKKCGISQTTYSHYETGNHLITTSTAYAICKTYHCSMDKLVIEIEN